VIRNENVYNYKYLLVFPVMDCEVNPLEESLTSFTSFTLESGNEQNATEGNKRHKEYESMSRIKEGMLKNNSATTHHPA
jgi:hypothetical protein